MGNNFSVMHFNIELIFKGMSASCFEDNTVFNVCVAYENDYGNKGMGSELHFQFGM